MQKGFDLIFGHSGPHEHFGCLLTRLIVLEQGKV